MKTENFENCQLCTVNDGCEQVGICKVSLKESTEKFLSNFEKKITKDSYDRSKIKVLVYEFEGKTYFKYEGTEEEIVNLVFNCCILDKKFEKIFLRTVSKRVQAIINQKIKF